MTYTVSSGTLNPTQLQLQLRVYAWHCVQLSVYTTCLCVSPVKKFSVKLSCTETFCVYLYIFKNCDLIFYNCEKDFYVVVSD